MIKVQKISTFLGGCYLIFIATHDCKILNFNSQFIILTFLLEFSSYFFIKVHLIFLFYYFLFSVLQSPNLTFINCIDYQILCSNYNFHFYNHLKSYNP